MICLIACVSASEEWITVALCHITKPPRSGRLSSQLRPCIILVGSACTGGGKRRPAC